MYRHIVMWKVKETEAREVCEQMAQKLYSLTDQIDEIEALEVALMNLRARLGPASLVHLRINRLSGVCDTSTTSRSRCLDKGACRRASRGRLRNRYTRKMK